MMPMEISGKIMILGLPAALGAALAHQLGPDRLTEKAQEAALVIRDENEPGNAGASPAVPVLDVRLDRPQRLGALLRQARQMLEEPALYLDAFALGPYLFQPQEKSLAREGAAQEDPVSLTDKEVDILIYLARRAPGAVAREDLLRDVWRYQEGVDTHTLETHIYRLRQKIEESAENPRLLVTDEKGYRLAA